MTNRRLTRSRSHAFIAFFNVIAVPARWRPGTSLTLPTIALLRCLSALTSFGGYCQVSREAARRLAADGGRQRGSCCFFRHDLRPTAGSGNTAGADHEREISATRQLSPSAAPASLAPPEVAPAPRGPAAPIVAPVLGGWRRRRRDRHTGAHISCYRCTSTVVAGDDGRLSLGCSSRRWAKKRPQRSDRLLLD